jgi:hypothetical protein
MAEREEEKKELERWAEAAGKQGEKRVWGTTGWTSLDSVSGPVTHVEAQLNSIRCIYTQTVCVCVCPFLVSLHYTAAAVG